MPSTAARSRTSRCTGRAASAMIRSAASSSTLAGATGSCSPVLEPPTAVPATNAPTATVATSAPPRTRRGSGDMRSSVRARRGDPAAVIADQQTMARFEPIPSQPSGSNGWPLTCTSKCRWGPVTQPVVPV